MIKIWIDDRRSAPEGYNWYKSVNETIDTLSDLINFGIDDIELIDIDHDAGDFACDGGDYIRILDWLEEIGRSYPIRIHSANAVGIANMRRIIERNGWKEVK